VGKLPSVVIKLPGGFMIQYKTVIGPAHKIDVDVNHLASEGWVVQQAFVVGSVDIGEIDETGMPELEMPVIAYVMIRDVPTQQEAQRPQRKVIGGTSII
jgi:hypothetical protein